MLEWRNRYYFLAGLVEKGINELDENDTGALNLNIRYLCVELCSSADALFATCVAATSKWVRQFKKEMGMVIVDEAGAVPLLEALVVWKGNVPLVGVGDNAQLAPTSMMEGKKFPNGKPMNAMADQYKLSILQAMISNRWPYWRLKEQLRIERGGFDLCNFLFYKNEIVYHESVCVSAAGKAFEKWSVEYSAGYGGAITSSSKDGSKVFPVLMDISNSTTFREVRGTSKGNTYFVNFGVDSIFDFLQKNPTFKASQITVVVPYLKQKHLWIETAKRYQELRGLLIVETAESIQGNENVFIWWDTVCGADVGTSFGWLAGPKRCCVSLSRHVSGLIVIGNSRVGSLRTDDHSAAASALKAKGEVDNSWLTDKGRMLKMFHQKGRGFKINGAKPIPNPHCTIITGQVL